MRALLATLLACTLAAEARSEVVRFEVTETVPAFEGRSFGPVGPYVRITGRATIALDPADPRNAIIADIGEAPRNAQGRVEAVTDVVILRPADARRGNRTLLLDVPNRGRKLMPQLFDDAAQPGANRAAQAADAGIGFLHREGYTMVWVGWQADLESRPDQLAVSAPVLRGVTGPMRDEFTFDHTRSPATATLSWPIADPASLTVTVRGHWSEQRQRPEGLAIRATGANTVEITRPAAGFDAGALYEVTYTARDPIVLGMGLAATRDVAAFLRRDGSAANPLAEEGRSTISHAIAYGASQSGRFLRDFLWLGFNEDLRGRLVFDGMIPHIAGARRMPLNVRFGLPNRNARHPEDPSWQADLFPFTYATMDDPLSGRRDGLMLRCRLNNTCPKIMHTDSEHEWWASRGSLIVTDVTGNHIDLPADVRAYMIAGTPHYAPPADQPRRIAAAAMPTNPLHAGPPMRALLVAMQAWITDGIEPPASRVPMRAHGTLVAAADALPVAIPGLRYDGFFSPAAFSDQTVFPPKELGSYPVFVPLADRDGMAVGGVRMVQLAVPRATYTGWNPRSEGFGPTVLFPLQGIVLPFAGTKAEREAARDPRPSIEERYPTAAFYVAAVRAEAARLVAERLMLAEDAERAVAAAEAGTLAQLSQ